jgi:hypothetical protein
MEMVVWCETPPYWRVDSVVNNCLSVINGVISLPIAVLAYFFLPDTPGTAKPNWIFNERVSVYCWAGCEQDKLKPDTST